MSKSPQQTALKQLRWLVFLFCTLVACVLFIIFTIKVFQGRQKLAQRNIDQTLNLIKCSSQGCAFGDFENNTTVKGADYIVIKESKFLYINNKNTFPDLFKIDTNFISKFQHVSSLTLAGPDNERWRVFSIISSIKTLQGEKEVAIFVGNLEEVSWRLTRASNLSEIDAQLRESANSIFSMIRGESAEQNEIIAPLVSTRADAYAVVDVTREKILESSGVPPLFLSPNFIMPKSGSKLMVNEGKFVLVRSDETDSLFAISQEEIGSLWAWLFSLCFLLVLAGSSWFFGKKFFLRYLAISAVNVPSLEKALKSGERGNVEFKRGIVEKEILKTIVAYANTNNGVIYLGVDDHGHVTGISFECSKDRDIFLHKMYEQVRNHIRPLVLFDIVFEDYQGFDIIKIIVSKGDAFCYTLDGIVYIRHGESDVAAHGDWFSERAHSYR
jgi:hypothetical protein